MCVSDYVPWKKLERKRSSNLETQKPCCPLDVYSFLAEKGWQVILKGQRVFGKKAETVACPFHWLKGHRIMPVHPGSKLLPAVARLQPLVCCYKLCLCHLKYFHSCLITSVSLNSSVEMGRGGRFSIKVYRLVLWQNTEAVPAVIPWYSYIWHSMEEEEKRKKGKEI